MTVDLERERDLHSLFPSRIRSGWLQNGGVAGPECDTRKTLLFLDEIQACPPALALLRYFSRAAAGASRHRGGVAVGFCAARVRVIPCGGAD